MERRLLHWIQICCFASLLAWIAIQFVQPFPHFWMLFWILLIGYAPTYFISRFVADRYHSYISITNGGIIVTAASICLEPYQLPSLFLIPVFLSLVRERISCFFYAIFLSAIGMAVSYRHDPMYFVIELIVFLIIVSVMLLIMKAIFESKNKRVKTLEGIKAFSLAVEAKDSYTNGHSRRVAKYAGLIAKLLQTKNLSADDAELCGYVHDIGKIKTPDHILRKEGRLTAEEFEIIKRHSLDGYEYLQSFGLSEILLQGVLYHHERWDGKGYPYGLSNHNIPLIARVLAIADTFDAITTMRTYKKSKSPEWALEEIIRCSGTQFDPELVRKFVENFDQIVELYQETELETKKEKTRTIKELLTSGGF